MQETSNARPSPRWDNPWFVLALVGLPVGAALAATFWLVGLLWPGYLPPPWAGGVIGLAYGSRAALRSARAGG